MMAEVFPVMRCSPSIRQETRSGGGKSYITNANHCQPPFLHVRKFRDFGNDATIAKLEINLNCLYSYQIDCYLAEISHHELCQQIANEQTCE